MGRKTEPVDYGREAGREFERRYREWAEGSRGGRVALREVETSAPPRVQSPVQGGFGYAGGDVGGAEKYASDDAPFVDKGPKGYRRSDPRIHEDVCERLSDGHLDASDIEVAVQDGEVTLEGTVETKQDKRLAEDLAHGVRGVHDVHNRIALRRAH